MDNIVEDNTTVESTVEMLLGNSSNNNNNNSNNNEDAIDNHPHSDDTSTTTAAAKNRENRRRTFEHTGNVVIDEREVNFIVLQWISKQTATMDPSILDTLFNHFNQNNLLEKRIAWDGSKTNYSLSELRDKYNHCTPNYLKDIMYSYKNLLNEKGHHSTIPFGNVNSLLARGDYSMVPPVTTNNKQSTTTTIEPVHNNNNNNINNIENNINSNINNPIDLNTSPDIVQQPLQQQTPLNIQQPPLQPQILPPPLQQHPELNITKPIQAKPFKPSTINYMYSQFGVGDECSINCKLLSRELKASQRIKQPLPCSNTFENVLSVQAHKAPIYCFTYDRTGSRFITGSDDHLVKIWSSYDGRLSNTLRAHAGDITDMSVSFDNSLLATASNDNIIRIWNMDTCEPHPTSHALMGHEVVGKNFITSVSFCPNPYSNILLSTDCLGVCRLWNLNNLNQSSIINETSIVHSSTFNNGGTLVFLTCTNLVKIYSIESFPPTLVATLEGHTQTIKLLQCNHTSDRIISGSDDGHVFIWKHTYENHWENISFYTKQLSKRKEKLKTMIWSLDDRYIVTADYTLKVWNSHDATLHTELAGHLLDVFVLDSHPFDKRLIMSAGYDSQLIIWDIELGCIVKKFVMDSTLMSSQILDGGFSPDGMQICITTNFGKWCLFELGETPNSLRFYNTPCEQFFYNDYHSLLRDIHGNVLDETTQTAPHLTPRPLLLVNYQGVSYGVQPPQPLAITPFIQTPEHKYEKLKRERFVEYEHHLRDKPKFVPTEFNMQHDKPPPPPQQLNQPTKKGRKRSNRNNTTNDSEVTEESFEDFDIPIPSDNSDDDFTASSSDGEVMDITEDGVNQDNDEDDDYEEEEDDEDDDDGEEEDDDGNQITTRSKTRKTMQRKRRQILKRNVPLTRSRTADGELDDIIETLGLPDELSSDEYDDDDSINIPERRGRPKKSTIQNQYKSSDDEGESDEEEDDDYDYNSMSEDENNNNGSNQTKRRRRKAKFTLSPKKYKPHTSTTTTTTTTSNGVGSGGGRGRKPKKMNIVEPVCPNWISTTTFNPLESSYTPQIGDRVIYFHQGHKKYLNVYPDENPQDVDLFLLWISTAEECIVKDIKYIIASPQSENPGLHQAHIVLKCINGDDEINVYYHVSDLPDYLVLASRINRSLSIDWKVGKRLKMFYPDENQWFRGSISEISPCDSKHQDSPWERFTVKWDQDDTETRVSPWEIEQLEESELDEEMEKERVNNNNNNNNEENEEADIDNDQYNKLVKRLTSTTSSKQQHEDESEQNIDDGIQESIDESIRNEIQEKLQSIIDLEISEPYRDPVDLTLHPLYIHYIPHPMDFTTIIQRLENNYYRRVAAIRMDAELVMKNAFTYNQPNTSIARNSKIVYNKIKEMLSEYLPEDADLQNQSINNTNSSICNDDEEDEDEGEEQDDEMMEEENNEDEDEKEEEEETNNTEIPKIGKTRRATSLLNNNQNINSNQSKEPLKRTRSATTTSTTTTTTTTTTPSTPTRRGSRSIPISLPTESPILSKRKKKVQLVNTTTPKRQRRTTKRYTYDDYDYQDDDDDDDEEEEEEQQSDDDDNEDENEVEEEEEEATVQKKQTGKVVDDDSFSTDQEDKPNGNHIISDDDQEDNDKPVTTKRKSVALLSESEDEGNTNTTTTSTMTTTNTSTTPTAPIAKLKPLSIRLKSNKR